MKGFDKIYVCCYEPLKERREYIAKTLKKYGMLKNVIWDMDKENQSVSVKDMKKYDSSPKTINEMIKVLGPGHKNMERKLNYLQIKLMLHTIRILKRIAKRKGNNISMVVEDDVIFNDDFDINLKKLIKKLEIYGWDIVYATKGGRFSEPISRDEDGIGLYVNQESNTCGCYLLTPRSARKYLKHLKTFSASPDITFHYIQKKHNFNVLHAVPFLTLEGTIAGYYGSSLRKNNSKTQKMISLLKNIEKVSPRMSNELGKMVERMRGNP